MTAAAVRLVGIGSGRPACRMVDCWLHAARGRRTAAVRNALRWDCTDASPAENSPGSTPQRDACFARYCAYFAARSVSPFSISAEDTHRPRTMTPDRFVRLATL